MSAMWDGAVEGISPECHLSATGHIIEDAGRVLARQLDSVFREGVERLIGPVADVRTLKGRLVLQCHHGGREVALIDGTPVVEVFPPTFPFDLRHVKVERKYRFLVPPRAPPMTPIVPPVR